MVLCTLVSISMSSSSSMSLSLKQQHHYTPSPQPKMDNHQHFNFKATELRLGLPGSDSPERTTINGVLAGSFKKRGFSDTINAPSATWVFSSSSSSSSSSASPRGENKNPNSAIKEPVVSSSTKHVQVSASNIQDFSSKSHVVGWPPIRSFRKNTMAAKNTKNEDDPNAEMGSNCVYVKVSMDGAPYLRKVDLKMYLSYMDLSSALEKMFSSFTLGQKGEGLTESPFMALLDGSEYVLTYEDKDGDQMLVGDVPWVMFTGSCKRMRIMKSSDAIGLAPRAMEKRKGHD